MGRLRDPQLERRWSRRVERHRAGGLTVAEFCRREGVTLASFYYWRRRLVGEASHSSQAPPLFVPIRIDEESPARDRTPVARPFEIDLPGGVHLRLDATPEPEWIGRLVAAVAGLGAEEGGS